MEEKEFMEKLTKLLIHVGADLAFLLVIPRNESLIKFCSMDDVKKMLQNQSDSALGSFFRHISFYEKSLQEVSSFDISALNDYELLDKNINALTSSINDVKILYDKNLLHLKKNEQPEGRRVMEFLEKTVGALTEIVGNVVERASK